jgi:hypothetical protein
MLICITVLEGLTDFCWFVRSLVWLCLVHCLGCSGSGDAVDVLASGSCTSRAVVGLAGPRLQLLPPLVLCDGGVFTATMASVASSLIPWLRVSFWLSLSHSSMISWPRAHDLGLHCVVVWLWFGHGLICWLLASIFAVKLLSSGIAGYPK